MRVLWCILAVAACNEEPDTDSNMPADPDPLPLDFYPTPGEWESETIAHLEDTCGIIEELMPLGPNGGGILITPDGLGFDREVVGEEDTEHFCTLDGQTFDCEAETFEQYLGSTVFTEAVTRTGSFTDADNATATHVLYASCAGPDCDQVEAELGTPLPCTMAAEVSWRKL